MPFLILGIFLPRLAAALLYFFTGWFNGVFQTWYWPLLGFIFMPYTMLWYSVVMNWYDGTWGTFQIVVGVIAVAIDLTSGERTRRW
jgi:hypothetical protein